MRAFPHLRKLSERVEQTAWAEGEYRLELFWFHALFRMTSYFDQKSWILSPKREANTRFSFSTLIFALSYPSKKRRSQRMLQSTPGTWGLCVRCFSFLFSHAKQVNAQKFIQYLLHWMQELYCAEAEWSTEAKCLNIDRMPSYVHIFCTEITSFKNP